MEVAAGVPSDASAHDASPTSPTVLSKDGTTLAYRERGDGPGVVLIHGGMQWSQSFSVLADLLSTSFRVFVPDRRGRGRSGPFGSAYCMAREVEDVEALLRKTGARFVFGLSSGALVALAAARALPCIDKLAVYEPPLATGGVDPAAWTPRYEREVARGRLASAMVTILKGTGDAEMLTYLPRGLLVPLMAVALRRDARRRSAAYVPMCDLIPTVRYDAQLQREASAPLLAGLSEIRSDVLLMGGDRSHRSLRRALDALARRMPAARRVILSGVGHIAAADVGRPHDVAVELRTFFAASG
jgi:pimeloyl-ACP methyl ester carboxylesterase